MPDLNILVILAHPGKTSFNHAIAKTVLSSLDVCGHKGIFHDLYAERFDPLLPHDEIPRGAPLPPVIAAHCREIASADGIVIIHPDWWGMPPAILKGWVDRVMRPGVAYRFHDTDTGEGIPEGLLRARAALIFNTSNTPDAREQEVFGDPLERLWKDCIFSFCGVTVFRRRMYGVMVTSTSEQREAWLAEVHQLVQQTFPR